MLNQIAHDLYEAGHRAAGQEASDAAISAAAASRLLEAELKEGAGR
ncbi:hypothetical protein [Ancylobacter lacus]|nr:hypothetical protein [Ancylobacter lacus]MBS7541485.1 hypothetical protein [Ancylobacter lacus]